MSAPLRTGIAAAGQAYVDEPVYAPVKACHRSPLAQQLARLFGHPPPSPLLLYYQRIPLRWLKPDGAGRLIRR